MESKDKSEILYINFLPLILIVAVMIGAGYFLTKGEINLPKTTKSPNEIERIEGYPLTFDTTHDIEKQRHVITSQEELDNFFKIVDPDKILYFGGNVNFNKEILIAIASETEDYGQKKSRIKRVSMDKDKQKLTVEIHRTIPDEECLAEEIPQKSISVDFVKLQKTDWQIDFDSQKQTIKCNNKEE